MSPSFPPTQSSEATGVHEISHGHSPRSPHPGWLITVPSPSSSHGHERNWSEAGSRRDIISQPPRQGNDYQTRNFSPSPSRLAPPPDSPSSIPSDTTAASNSLKYSPEHAGATIRGRASEVVLPKLSRLSIPSIHSSFGRSSSWGSSRQTFPPIQPRTAATIRPRPNRKLRNRDYYPSAHHQMFFDEFERFRPIIYQQREKEGLNYLDGDLDQVPLYAMPIIIECAILGSPQHRLTLSELRVTLKRRFRHYEKEEEKGAKSWERTLLQNLSKKERFVNVERPEPGQGGYWTLNHDAPPSNRARKRNPRPRTSGIQSPLPLDIMNSDNLNDEIRRSQSPAPMSLSPDTAVDLNVMQQRSASVLLTRPPEFSPSSSSSSTVTTGAHGIGGPYSYFRYVPTQRYPDGRLMGRHEMSIQLPNLSLNQTNTWASMSLISTSPRHFRITSPAVIRSNNENREMTFNSITRTQLGPENLSGAASPNSQPFMPKLPPLWR